MAKSKQITLYVHPLGGGTYGTYTENELNDAIDDGQFEDGAKFFTVTIEGKPKKLKDTNTWELV